MYSYNRGSGYVITYDDDKTIRDKASVSALSRNKTLKSIKVSKMHNVRVTSYPKKYQQTKAN